jgi:hypothetical protein
MADIEIPEPDSIEEAKASRFTKVGALTVAGFAVILAICSLGGSNAGKDTNINQQQASNQWAYYQAKNIRKHACDLLIRDASVRLALLPKDAPAEGRKALETMIAEVRKESARYDEEKKEIEIQARSHEAARDLATARDPFFDYGEVLLQIAIVMASIAMLSSSRITLVISIVVALVGGALTLNGYMLFVTTFPSFG